MVFISFLLNTFFADVLGYEVKPAVGASTEDDDLPGMRRREVVVEVVGKDLCIYKHTLPKTNMDTPNYVLEKGDSVLKYGLFVGIYPSMLNLCGVFQNHPDTLWGGVKGPPKRPSHDVLRGPNTDSQGIWKTRDRYRVDHFC